MSVQPSPVSQAFVCGQSEPPAHEPLPLQVTTHAHALLQSVVLPQLSLPLHVIWQRF